LKVKSPYYVEVNSLNDFGRFVCALERTPMPTFSLSLNSDQVLAVQADIINERPIIYFVKNSITRQGHYLAYRITGSSEEITIVDSIGNPSFVYSPIINIEKLPPSMLRNARRNKKSGYTAIKLRDIYSLAKVAAYKTMFDEPPLPLFLFSKDDESIDIGLDSTQQTFVIGTALNLTESDSLSFFYYVVLSEEPKSWYLRFSSQSSEHPSFSNRIDEHGYVYLKIIRLARFHPLIVSYD
jgi:hypothetical protein